MTGPRDHSVRAVALARSLSQDPTRHVGEVMTGWGIADEKHYRETLHASTALVLLLPGAYGATQDRTAAQVLDELAAGLMDPDARQPWEG